MKKNSDTILLMFKNISQILNSSKWKELYSFADFEEESQPGKVNIQFICCISDSKGKITRTFKGTGCAKQFLNSITRYLNAVVYLHNLVNNSMG